MRRLLLVPALLAAAPLHAQDAPDWVGVWEGRIGTLPVRACLDVHGADGPGHGSYYYLSRLEPIALGEAEDWEGGWNERAPGSETGAFWEMDDFDGQRIRGTWHQGDRALPIALEPVAWAAGEWDGPCGSEAFLGPRVGGGKILVRGTDVMGWRYAIRTYQPAAHFDEVGIQVFTYPSTEPGDANIKAWLDDYLPRETVGDDFVQCLGGAISALGTDGSFELTVAPGAVSRAFIGIVETSGTFCGGAHPSYYTVAHTYDRQSGEEVDLFDWLGASGVGGEGSGLSADLRGLILSRWPPEVAECREYAEEARYWSLGLAGEGLVFRPDFPHAMTACEEPVTVDWQALQPFLDDDGRAGLARLRGG